MKRILLVEDDKNMARQICYYLDEEDCYQIEVVENAKSALNLSLEHFDIILLDVMLPDGNGIDLCNELRKHQSCPILFISCLNDSSTIIHALYCGGDDYITKPFDHGILHARIQANLSRVQIEQQEKNEKLIENAGITLNGKNQTVEIDGTIIPLLPIEFRILAFLMQNPGECYRSSELYHYLWGTSSYGDNRTVVVHIYNLRKKIEKDPKFPKIIRSIWKKGYCFDPLGSVQEG